MKKSILSSTYSVKVKHYNHIFKDTIVIFRRVVDFLINVCINEWDDLFAMSSTDEQNNHIERLIHATKHNPMPKYVEFDKLFYKLPSYYRRSAASSAIAIVKSCKNSFKKKAPTAEHVYPRMYRKEMYARTDMYNAKIKVFIRNTWDWISVKLRKSDIDYINRHCKDRKECAPVLQKRGKEWFLDFCFEESYELNKTDIFDQTVVAVDLGINTAATISVMRSDGTILDRHFCKLTKETDSLTHSLNRIKKAQQQGNRRMPRLWAKAKGINHDISIKTARYIMDIAEIYNADVIVFEYLDTAGKKRGFKKQKLHMWRKQEVQEIVTHKAHRAGIRISHVCAWGTSKLAFDGSGVVSRGKAGGFNTYEICRFSNGKIYNCDLSASYNIGARYFIREITKSLCESTRLVLEAKVPQVTKRSTSTFATLINLNNELMAVGA